jgi:ribosomal protein S12 methylthiotransferase
MEIQQGIAFDWADRQLGTRKRVLIDSAVPGEDHAWIGRTTADAPDVDCVVYVTAERLVPGEFAECEIVARSEYDLVGVAV